MLGAVVACSPSDSAQSASTPPPNLNDPNYIPYGSRAPRPCPNITHQPNTAAAAVLVQCSMEGMIARDNLELLTNVTVQIVGSHAFRPADQDLHPAIEAANYTGPRQDMYIDPRAKVLDTTVSATLYNCGPKSGSAPNANCLRQFYTNVHGACWRMQNGQWRCNLQGTANGWNPDVPPPTAY